MYFHQTADFVGQNTDFILLANNECIVVSYSSLRPVKLLPLDYWHRKWMNDFDTFWFILQTVKIFILMTPVTPYDHNYNPMK